MNSPLRTASWSLSIHLKRHLVRYLTRKEKFQYGALVGGWHLHPTILKWLPSLNATSLFARSQIFMQKHKHLKRQQLIELIYFNDLCLVILIIISQTFICFASYLQIGILLKSVLFYPYKDCQHKIADKFYASKNWSTDTSVQGIST